MKLNKKTQLSILLIICLISIGFAYLSANLDIFGIANIKPVKWNIYFDDVNVLEGQNFENIAPTTSGKNTSSLSFEVTLEDPGDKYSFNVDVVNDGTVDAMVSLITKSNLTAEQQKIFDYTVTYSDGSPIEEKNYLGAGRSDTFTVTVNYKKNINIEDLPDNNVTNTFTVDLTYVQAKDADNRQSTNKTIVKDLSGNGNHGKIVGATLSDEGVQTDGKNDYVNCGLRGYEFPNGLSYVVRVKMLSVDNNDAIIFGNADAGGTTLNINGNRIYSKTWDSSLNDYVETTSNIDININQFYIVTVTISLNKTTLYINGAYAGESDINELKLTTPVSFALGTNLDFEDSKVSGFSNLVASDILMFNRVLDSQEISSNFSDQINLVNKSALLLYYNFK